MYSNLNKTKPRIIKKIGRVFSSVTLSFLLLTPSISFAGSGADALEIPLWPGNLDYYQCWSELAKDEILENFESTAKAAYEEYKGSKKGFLVTHLNPETKEQFVDSEEFGPAVIDQVSPDVLIPSGDISVPKNVLSMSYEVKINRLQYSAKTGEVILAYVDTVRFRTHFSNPWLYNLDQELNNSNPKNTQLLEEFKYNGVERGLNYFKDLDSTYGTDFFGAQSCNEVTPQYMSTVVNINGNIQELDKTIY